MKRAFAIASVVVCLLAPKSFAELLDSLDSNDPWPMYMQNDRNTGNSSAIAINANYPVPRIVWKQQLPVASGSNPVEFAPVIVNGDGYDNGTNARMVIVAAGQEVLAFDTQNSQLMWSYQSNGGGIFNGKLSVADVYTGAVDGTGAPVREKVVYAGASDGIYAIPIKPSSPGVGQSRTDNDNLWKLAPQISQGTPKSSWGGYTPLSFKALNDQGQYEYKTLMIGRESTQYVVARDAVSGHVNLIYHDTGTDSEDVGQQPAIGLSGSDYEHSVSANVYLASWNSGATGTATQLKAYQVSSNGQLTSGPVWQGNISLNPSFPDAIHAGSFASPTVANAPGSGTDQYVYEPSDNGALYVFDRELHPQATFADPVHADFISTTAGVFANGQSNLIYTSREHTNQLTLEHDSAGNLTATNQTGTPNLYGAVTVDGAGSGLYMGEIRKSDGSLLFDLSYTTPEDPALGGNTKAFEVVTPSAYNAGFVTPIDSDGSVYVVAKSNTDGNYYLYAIRDFRGDMNGDGKITNADVAPFEAAFGSVYGDDNYRAAADMNRDGRVTNADLLKFAAALNGGGGFGGVPEPTSVTLLTAAIAFYLLGRKPRLKCVPGTPKLLRTAAQT
jgi:hypothetical protein